MDGRLLLARINTVWRVPLILLITAVLGSLSLLVSVFDGTGRGQHACARLWSRLILLISRVRVEVKGLTRLDSKRGYVFAANHLSMFDHWAFLAHLPFQFRFVAKSSLFQWPFLGWHLKRSGNIPADPHHPTRTLRAIQRVADRVRQGMSFVIYPEGMRTWGDGVAPFKKGAFLLARESGAPIVPVTIVGAQKRLPRGSIVIRPGRMRLVIHSPVESCDYADWSLEQLAQHVRTIIVDTYQRE